VWETGRKIYPAHNKMNTGGKKATEEGKSVSTVCTGNEFQSKPEHFNIFLQKSSLVHLHEKKMSLIQCCGAGAARSQHFWLEP
jgi:hypothetical protein